MICGRRKILRAAPIDVEWEENTSTKEYTAHIDIYGLNRAGPFERCVTSLVQYNQKYLQTVNALRQRRISEICQHPHVSFKC